MKAFFKKLLDLWIEFGKILNKVISPIMLALIYFVIFGMASGISKIIGTDLLERKYNGKSYWKNLKFVKKKPSLQDYTRQF